MRTLLRIDVSSRKEGSASRELADFFQEQWQKKYPNGKLVSRDLVDVSIPHISNLTIAGFYSAPEDMTEELKSATALSDEIIEEISNADEVLISTPLYNFGMPSALKAYIDQLVRINKTFGIDENGNFFGMLKNINAYVTTAKGAVYQGTPIEKLDMQEPYLQLILPFLGINLVDIIRVEGTTMDEVHFKNTNQEAKRSIEKLISKI